VLGFLFYGFLVTVFAVVMIYKVAPKYGKKNPMIYISICSTVGSISIMAIKGFGIALKLTLGGNNQLTNPSTYVFAIIVVVCILTQMNYFNKALSQYSTNMYASPYKSHNTSTNNINLQCQPALLRNLHNLHPHRLLHSLPGLQHHRRNQHHFAALRLPDHLHRRLPPESQPRRPRRHQPRHQLRPRQIHRSRRHPRRRHRRDPDAHEHAEQKEFRARAQTE
jgi:hypothetical protein